MPIGSVSKGAPPKRETFRPPWVKDKESDAAPSWTQRRLKPVEKAGDAKEAKTEAAASAKEEAPAAKPALKPTLKKQTTIKEKDTKDKAENGTSEVVEDKLVKPSASKLADKATRPADEKPRFTKSSLKSASKPAKTEETNDKPPEKPTLRSVKTIDKDKDKEKTVTIVEKPKFSERNGIKSKTNSTAANDSAADKKVNSVTKDTKPKAEEKSEEKSKMATKPPIEKPPSKLPPRKPSLVKQLSKDEPVKKWRDPLHERVKENIDKTLANEVPKGHTLTKNESLRKVPKSVAFAEQFSIGSDIEQILNSMKTVAGLLKPTPPPPPMPPAPPKLPPPPEFMKGPLDPEKLKKLEQLKSRPRRRPDWTDMMKEVESGKKLKHVVCNDRSQPIITRSMLVKNKEKPNQFIFESESKTPAAHNKLLNEISLGVKLKKTKTNDRSKPNLEGLRKFRRQMTIEEQVQKSMSQANLLAASPSGASVSEINNQIIPGVEEEEIDEMDDIDKVRDDLQSTKQLLAIELRNKEAQERENKRLLTRIRNLEAELARERALVKQEQHKTVISVTDAYDERLVNSLKQEVEKTKENADSLEKQYLDAAEGRDEALTELEEVKRKNAELEKKLEQALASNLEGVYIQEEPLSFYQKRQLDFEKQCRLLNIDLHSAEAIELRAAADSYNNDNVTSTNWQGNKGIMPSIGSRRSSHAVKQLSVTRDNSFEEEEESEPEEEESEEKKQKRIEKEIRNMRNKISHLKQKQDNMKRERMAYKMSLKNQQAALKNEKKKYKELKREVDKMAAMMKEVGSDEEEDEEDEDSDEEKKSESEEEETETETEQDTESETESESEPEDAPLPKKKENLTGRVKRHETRVNALKKGNALLIANVDRMKDDVLRQRDESADLQKELDSIIDDLQ